jgi:hypothetical protein
MKPEKWRTALVGAEQEFFNLLSGNHGLSELFEFPDSTVLVMAMDARYSICPNTLSCRRIGRSCFEALWYTIQYRIET